MIQNTPRTLSPYEKNHLRKYGISESLVLSSDKPVEYYSNHVTFCGLDFFVNKSVLIPRVETEELVELVLKHVQTIIKKKQSPIQIADIGTGSGAVAISIKHSLDSKNIANNVLAVDISREALDIAQKNAQQILKKSSQQDIQFLENNLLTNIDQQFDLIVANLPYIPSTRIPFLDASVKDFEPHLALDGGSDGLQLITQLIRQAEQVVNKDGFVLLEVDLSHTKDSFTIFKNQWNITIQPDSMGGINFVTLQKK